MAILKFNIAKCKVMHIGRPRYENYSFLLKNHTLPVVSLEKDLGVLVDDNLKFHNHTATVIAKANSILAIINKSFVNLDANIFPMLYKSLVRPILEYGNPVWGPLFVTDQQAIEKVQRRATKMIPAIRHLSYRDCLSSLKLPSLSRGPLQTILAYVI